MPLRLQRQLKETEPGNDKWIPYAYCSVKTKCHDVDGPGRTCVKESHSCCRKIVSAQWNVKGKWKHIGTAMETMTKRCSGGSETWTLKKAASELRDKIQRVRTATREPTNRCQRCGMEKTTVGRDRRRPRPVLRSMSRAEGGKMREGKRSGMDTADGEDDGNG